MGAQAYRLLSLYEPDPGWLVEVGSERGEGSTAWLRDYAERTGLGFTTCDIDPAQHAEAERIAPGHAICGRGRDVIAQTKPISAAYLDGFDFIPPGREGDGFITEQRDRYDELGFTLSNGRCHAEHLAEAKALERRANRRCVVICDDTWQGPRGGWKGKGATAVPYLLRHGFCVIEVVQREKTSLGATVLRRG